MSASGHGVALALRQVRYEHRAFWRNPAAAFFTFVFPLIFLVIFNLMFGNEEITIAGGSARGSTFYVPAIVAMSVVNSCFTGLAMSLTVARDGGLLKRTRGTPLPAWAYFAGRVLYVTLVMLLLVVIVTAAGALAYDVDVPTRTAPAALVALLVGAAAFCALGFAVCTIVPNADAAPAVVNAIVLPLLFISDVFIPPDNAPAWLTDVANVFPVRHLSVALQTAFNPFERGAGFQWTDLAMVAAWGALGAAIALRRFSWEPRR